MISISHNWLFIHTPRTGGNSVQSVLACYSEDQLTRRVFQDGIERFGVQGSYTGNKHFRLQDYADTVPPEIFSKLFKFTVARNPWARAISWFFTPLKWISAGRQPALVGRRVSAGHRAYAIHGTNVKSKRKPRAIGYASAIRDPRDRFHGPHREAWYHRSDASSQKQRI
jgi:hypothetical protein